jgi:hypothetical protein
MAEQQPLTLLLNYTSHITNHTIGNLSAAHSFNKHTVTNGCSVIMGNKSSKTTFNLAQDTGSGMQDVKTNDPAVFTEHNCRTETRSEESRGAQKKKEGIWKTSMNSYLCQQR